MHFDLASVDHSESTKHSLHSAAPIAFKRDGTVAEVKDCVRVASHLASAVRARHEGKESKEFLQLKLNDMPSSLV